MPGIKSNVLLKNFTTYKIGGPAKYFFAAKNRDGLMKALKTAKEFNLPVFILGGGSNVLVSDKGFKGLVIKMQNANIKIKNDSEKSKIIFVEAGTLLSKLIDFCVKNGLSGLEWAAGIPGITVGGAIYGHAQAFGEKMSDVVKSVEAVDEKTLKIINFTKKQCLFFLKNSIFKKNKNLAIISAVLELVKKNPKEIKNKIKENLNYRKKAHPLNFPSAGSVFVNPEIVVKNKNLLTKFPELIEYNNKNGVIPAGYLISKCGLSEKRIGNAQISKKHCNFIINLGGAKAKDVLSLMELVKKEVKKTFGIELETEVQLVGF